MKCIQSFVASGVIVLALTSAWRQPQPVNAEPRPSDRSLLNSDPAFDPNSLARPVGESPKVELPEAEASKIPTSLDELSALTSRSYDMSIDAAAELDIPFIASVGGGYARRVLVREFTQYKAIKQDDGNELHYGYAIRLCVTTSSVNTKGKTNLAWVAASVEMKQSEAEYVLEVRGLSGEHIRSQAIEPKDFDVETYVEAHQSIKGLIDAVSDPTTTFSADLVAEIPAKKDSPSFAYNRAVATSFALSYIEEQEELGEALEDFPSDNPRLVSVIAQVYRDVAGASAADEKVSKAAARAARELLMGVKFDS